MQKAITSYRISLLFVLLGTGQLYSMEQAVVGKDTPVAQPNLVAQQSLAQLPLAPMTKEHAAALKVGFVAGLVPLAGFAFCVWLAWQARAHNRPLSEGALAVAASAAGSLAGITALYVTYKGYTYALSYADVKTFIIIGILLYGSYKAFQSAAEHHAERKRHHERHVKRLMQAE